MATFVKLTGRLPVILIKTNHMSKKIFVIKVCTILFQNDWETNI